METTVVKGLKVLEALANSEQPASLGEIADICGLSKSNVHRLLQTLDACGYIGQDQNTRRYFATLKMWQLGIRAHSRLDFRTVAAPYLTSLAEKTEETVHLSVLDGQQALFVDKKDGSHAIRTYVNVGDRAPLYCSASGKALLAYLSVDVVDAVGTTIERHTDQTVRSVAELQKHLKRIRSLGFSLTTGEWRPGVTGVSAAVVSGDGGPIGAIGVAGPQERMRDVGHEHYIQAVLEAREGISHHIGLKGRSAQAQNVEKTKT